MDVFENSQNEYHCFFKKRNKEGTECKYYTQDNKLINV